MTELDVLKLPQRPRRLVEGALTGGLAGLLVGALTSRDDILAAVGIGAASGLTIGAFAPMPLAQALEQAASELKLTLVSANRTGPRGIAALVAAQDGYHRIQYEAANDGTRDDIDDELYGQLVRQMKALSCPT